MALKPEPKPEPPEDPFDIAGADDRSAGYLEKVMDGTAKDADYWKDDGAA